MCLSVSACLCVCVSVPLRLCVSVGVFSCVLCWFLWRPGLCGLPQLGFTNHLLRDEWHSRFAVQVREHLHSLVEVSRHNKHDAHPPSSILSSRRHHSVHRRPVYLLPLHLHAARSRRVRHGAAAVGAQGPAAETLRRQAPRTVSMPAHSNSFMCCLNARLTPSHPTGAGFVTSTPARSGCRTASAAAACASTSASSKKRPPLRFTPPRRRRQANTRLQCPRHLCRLWNHPSAAGGCRTSSDDQPPVRCRPTTGWRCRKAPLQRLRLCLASTCWRPWRRSQPARIPRRHLCRRPVKPRAPYRPRRGHPRKQRRPPPEKSFVGNPSKRSSS